MREKLADLCHRQWSGWMEYLFGKCAFNPNDGTATIPKWAVDRWRRQLSTEYAHLSEEEKNADRDEADRFLTLIAEAQPQTDNTASLKLPSWFDLTKDIAFKSTEALYAAKEIYSRIAACQLQA